MKVAVSLPCQGAWQLFEEIRFDWATDFRSAFLSDFAARLPNVGCAARVRTDAHAYSTPG
jgi:hypothetical protein